MGETVYDSRFDGAEIDELLEKVQTGKIDTCQLGEIRYSPKVDNPFGDKYVMCAGQPVSTDDYPDAINILPIKELGVAKKVVYPVLAEAPYQEMSNAPFPITDKLIGKMRIIAIPPATDNPTDEDYMAMYATMKMYIDISRDGENWTQVYEFLKREGEVFGATNPFVVNGKLIFPLQIVRFDLVNGTPTTEVGRLLITSDFENFSIWETIEMNVPVPQTNEWKMKSIAYGQGTYLAIFTETVGGQQKAALLKSIDLITWKYTTEVFPVWMDVASDFRLTVSFSGNRWLVQFGYTFVCDSIAEIDANHIIAEPSGSSIDYEFRQVFHLYMGVEEVYFVLLSNGVYSLSYDTNQNKWRSYKQDPPSGWGTGEKHIGFVQMGEGTLSWLVFGNSNHYYIFPTGEQVQTFSFENGATNWQLNEVFKLKAKLFLIPNSSVDTPCLSSVVTVAPAISNPEIGLNAYIKLKK